MAKLTEFGKFVSVQKSPDTGEVIGYRVRSRKNNVFKYFGVKEFSTPEKALKAAQNFSSTALKTKVLTADNYLEIRNKNKDLSTKNFANYLNNKTDFVPERGSKFTRDGIKQLDNKLNYKSPFIKTKKEIPENIKTKIHNEYKTQLSKGERNLSEIARKYFPNETRYAQSYLMRNVLVEKGEDISKFKKVKGPNFDEVKDRGSRVRRERLNIGKKAAGPKAGNLADSLVNDIKKLNNNILKMSDAEILSNKKLINSMKINANVNNLNKGIITFDKYDNLSAKELVKKIKDRAKAGTFWQPEHISSVQGQAKNIYYPNNLQAAPGNMGAFMENFKKIAAKDPTNPIIKKGGNIDKLLSDYNMTVRDNKTGVRLGFKDVIEVDSTNKTSNIINSNAEALGNKMNIFKTIGKAKTAIPAAALAAFATSAKADDPTYNNEIGAFVKPGTDEIESQSGLLDWASNNPEPLIAASAIGGAGLTTAGNTMLKGLLKTLAAPAAGVANAAYEISENLEGGDNILEAVADKSAGLGLMGSSAFGKGLGSLLGGAKLARSLTPVGAAMTAAGLGKDYYDFAQDEIEKMDAMSDYDRKIYNDMLMDDTNIDF